MCDLFHIFRLCMVCGSQTHPLAVRFSRGRSHMRAGANEGQGPHQGQGSHEG